jgi:S1-C subfamily serine protease
METLTPPTSGVLAALSDELAEAADRASRSVVAVHARARTTSSGVHWQTGAVVTAAHSIQRDEDITVTLPDGKSVPATLAGADPGTDLAVLRIEAGGLPTAELADPASLRIGHMVLALARDGDGDLGASLGVISALGGAWRTWRGGRVDRLVRLDLELYPGFSGGPLVDARGRIAGVNTSGLSRSMSIALPTTTVERVAAELLAKGHVPRGYLGLGMQPVRLGKPLRSSLGLTAETGLILLSVEPDSPAEKAGLLVGDILVKLGETGVGDIEDVQAVLGPESVGKPLRAAIVRAGALAERTVTVGAWARRER